MPVTNYYSVNGEIIGEKTTGSNRIDYLTDALGSVTATMDQSVQVVNTYRYKPYGAQLSKTGVGADPSFQWVGSKGYRQTGKKYSDIYVRARHYSANVGRWTTKDPLRLAGAVNEFNYVSGRPTTVVDPSGLIGIRPFGPFPPLSGTCGSSGYQVVFQVPRGFNGVLIQHVVLESNILNCTGASLYEPITEYWERWLVIDGIVYATNRRSGNFTGGGFDDEFSLPNHFNTKGCQSIHGYARLFPKGSVPGVPWITPPTNLNPPLPSGGLPYWPVKPPGWSDTGGVAHWLKSCWNCCPGVAGGTCYYALGPHPVVPTAPTPRPPYRFGPPSPPDSWFPIPGPF